MSGQKTEKQQNILVEELMGYTDQEQADMIAQHYAAVSNQYDAIKPEDFPEYLDQPCSPQIFEPLKVHQVIQSMNKKAATIAGDIPLQLIAEFSVESAKTLAHLLNLCLSDGVYPDILKSECVNTCPKSFPSGEDEGFEENIRTAKLFQNM